MSLCGGNVVSTNQYESRYQAPLDGLPAAAPFSCTDVATTLAVLETLSIATISPSELRAYRMPPVVRES